MTEGKTAPAEGSISYPNKSVVVRMEDGIAWVSLNRPEKRNAINPAIVFEMNEVLDNLEMDDSCRVVVITGSGDAFSAGQDLKEYFREPDAGPPALRERLHKANAQWQWRRLMHFPKPTIAMNTHASKRLCKPSLWARGRIFRYNKPKQQRTNKDRPTHGVAT